MSRYKTEQEDFWAGEFGDEYSSRNRSERLLASNVAFFARILDRCAPIRSVMEFGANVGMNLQALKHLLPEVQLSALEINAHAVKELRKIKELKVYDMSLLDFTSDYQRDFVFVKGVLIHIDPESLPQAYNVLYECSSRYICVAEYYNPKPVEVPYRGREKRLFKRDFAGEMMDLFDDLRLVDYGFVYHRDALFPQDDITWFLMEKSHGPEVG